MLKLKTDCYPAYVELAQKLAHRCDEVVTKVDPKVKGEAARDDGGVDGRRTVRVEELAAVPDNGHERDVTRVTSTQHMLKTSEIGN